MFTILISADVDAFVHRCQHQHLWYASVKPMHTITPLVRENYERGSVKLRQMGNDYLSNLSAADDNSKDEDTSKLQISTTPLNNVESVFKSATTRVSNKVGKTANDIKSITQSVTSGIGSVTSRGTNDIKTITRSVSSGIGSVAKKGASSITNEVGKRTSDIQSVARTASSGFESVAKKGAKDFRITTLYAGRAVKKGTKDAIYVAGKGVERSVSDTGKVATWIDSQAKAGTEAVTSSTKRAVLNFTGKSSYEFGDVSKETVRRIAAGEVNMQDFILLLKILIAIGATVGPLAELLPFTFLLEALNISIEQKVGGKVMEVLAKTLDSRIVGALFTSDDKNLLGDVAKRSLLSGILSFTGKQNYESGDIQRAVIQHENEDHSEEKTLDIDLTEFAGQSGNLILFFLSFCCPCYPIVPY